MSATMADRRRAVSAARQSGRGFIPQGRDEHGRPRKPLVVACNPPRFAWLRCARRCGYKVKVSLGTGLTDAVGGDPYSRCPECARRRRAVYLPGYGRIPVGLEVTSLVSR